MNIRRMAVSIAMILALVVLGGVTAGLLLARDQAPRAAPPSPDVMNSPQEVPATPAVVSGPAPKTGPAATPTPEPTAAPEPPAEPPMEGSTKEADPELEGASQGTVYTWQDGDRTLKAVLQATPVAQEKETAAGASEDYAVTKEDYAVTKEDHAVTKGEADSKVRKQSELGSNGQPVFRSQSGGELMTLPGGIILALDPEWDQDAVEKFFSGNGIELERISELDFLDNGFFVETEPGFPSLDLANDLADQEGVILSSPNWSREVELK